jgi:hypothetical protein
MTGNMWWGVFSILVGCECVWLGVATSRSQQRERPNEPTRRQWSRTEARFFLSLMGVLGLGMVCLGVTQFRDDFLFSLLAVISCLVGYASILVGLLRGRFTVTRTHDNQSREGR